MGSRPTPIHLQEDVLPLVAWDYAPEAGDAPRVLALHGYLDVGRSFTTVAERLRGAARLLALDWRGHGRSGRVHPEASYHQLDHLKDLARVLRELGERGLGPDLVLAHSMGGIVAFLHAASRPDATPPLVLLDTLGGFPTRPREPWEAFAGVLERVLEPAPPFRSFADLEAGVAHLRLRNPELDETAARRLARWFLREEDGRWVVDVDPRVRGPNPIRLSEETWRVGARRITVPVRVLVPERGILARVPETRERFEFLPDGRWCELADAGHPVHLTHPEVVAGLVRDTLVELSAR